MKTPDDGVNSQAEKLKAARLSVATNVVLTAVKLGVGIVSGSVSVIAEGAHSLTDVFASSLSLYSISLADRPPDQEHPFGHGKIENLSALFQGLFLIAVAIFIFREAVLKFLRHDRPEHLGPGMAVMVLSAAVNLCVIGYMNRVAKATDSDALRADAQDHRADIYAAIGVLAGLILVRITGNGLFDPLLAAGVACLIAWGAFHLVKDGIAHLLDATLPKDEIAIVRRVLEEDANVKAYHKLRTRKAGAFRQIDAHVLMDDNLSLLMAHTFTEHLEDKLRAALPNAVVQLHTEPFHEELRHQGDEHGETMLEYTRPADLNRMAE